MSQVQSYESGKSSAIKKISRVTGISKVMYNIDFLASVERFKCTKIIEFNFE